MEPKPTTDGQGPSALDPSIMSTNAQGPPQPLHKFCTHCQWIMDRFIGGDFPHHDTVPELYRSAKGGCPLCYRLASDNFMATFTDYPIKSCASLRLGSDGLWELALSIEGHPNDKNLGSEMFQRSLSDTGNWIHPKRTMTAKFIRVPTSSFKFQLQSAAIPTTKEALPLAKLWLDTCRKGHNSCWSTMTTTIPTRLIDLRGVNLKLIHGSDLENSIKYATLSHCWGDALFATLKKDCISQYLTHIPDMGLPRTFKEAVHIARYLNFDYLWIDSLCIVQDDTDDWRCESALMASVYGNSSLNIAATGASNSSLGCFLERQPLWRMQRKVGSEKTEQLFECVSKSYQENLDDNPLLRRGWVLQERILAPHTLHFTTTELFWVCKEMQVSETFPDEKWQPLSYKKSPSLLRPPFGLETWESLVTAYSHCQLTYARDKLVALSGLAQASQLGLSQKYLAGLWERELDRQLCWKVNRGSKHPDYCAPSWSWASLNGEVSFEQSHQDIVRIKVQGVHVQPLQPEEPYGQVKSATLHLICPGLFASNVTEFPALRGGCPLAGYFYELHAWGLDAKDEMDKRGQYTDYTDCFLLPMIQYQVGETYEPWTGSTEFAPAFTGLQYLTFFLLLRPTGALQGQYSRVGWVEICSVDDRSWIESTRITHGSQAQDSHYIESSQRQYVDGKIFTGVIELV